MHGRRAYQKHKNNDPIHHHFSFFHPPPPPLTPHHNHPHSLQPKHPNPSTHPTKLTSNPKTQSHYASLIQQCIDSNSFDLGKSIHSQILSDPNFHPDPFLQTKLLMLYARCCPDPNCLDDVRTLFDEMPEPNSTSYNTVILAHSRLGFHSDVFHFFLRMRSSDLPPDRFTFPSVVRACAALDDYPGLLQVHCLVVKAGLGRNAFVGGALVDAYVAFGGLDDAVSAFGGIDGENLIAQNAIIGGYVRLMDWEEAWRAFCAARGHDHFSFALAVKTCGGLRSLRGGRQVHARVIVSGCESDVFICNSLIDMYAKCGDLDGCSRVFGLMGSKEQVSWNSIASAQAQLGRYDEALTLFRRMLGAGFNGDRFNLGTAVMSCAGLGDVDMGRELHGHVVRRSLDSDVVLGSALVDMYCKFGLLDDARRAFDRLDVKNEVSWNALIAGYVEEGSQRRLWEFIMR
ncbi:putative pentatricopeptide repeat-containing protein [Acorus calamus]|uniref:Pentatricopeptide repeat-containing protein n=1 Tax=Acorus calamus TaxID=4465 RepID=A0AAV9EN80_ACOCL|nr:putative pentatricopeptide repeat-containing protein [Acorus calamus]